MKSTGLLTSRAVALVLGAALVSLQLPSARAEIVDTDALGAQSQAELDRAKVQAFMERADVKQRLQAMGVNGVVAPDRVAALSDEEVHALAQRVDSLPAGGVFTQTDLILVLLVVVLILVL